MSLTIRPLNNTRAEYNAIMAIHSLLWPEALFTGEHRQLHDAGRNPDFLFQRLVAERDGQIVAHANYGENPWSHRPGKYTLDIQVHPAYQRQGIGDALVQAIYVALAQQSPAPVLLTTGTRTDKTGALAFLAKHGFTEVMRHPSSTLDVQAFDGAAFAPILEKVRQAGFKIYSMTELKARNPNWIRIWYDLELAINDDVPTADRGEPLPFATFAGYVDGPLVATDAAFIAEDATGQYVGVSSLNIPAPGSPVLQTGMTGVLRSHRRQGLATALKVHAIQFAKAYGAKAIDTSNEEHNPMYQLNLALGFQPAPAWLDFEKSMVATT